ncbi:MAG: protein kinase domain-containing protein [Pyrinomonadaceae bacterium]
MQAERWQEIDRLFDAVLERAPAERASFLVAACAGDDELRREVESLLAASERAEKFIEAPAMEVAAKAAATTEAFTALGREIGPYRVLSLLGAGGMGEVYLAEDTRLGRRVALKLLLAEFTHDAERIRRFEREARAASALNHPNIVTIYETGQSDGMYFIATELVEGQTLRDFMPHARAQTKEALNIIAQVADALSAAHTASVVHRDLKPENIMLRPDGYVKVLDFGLAKLIEPAPAHDASHKWTETARTDTGAVLGTVAYMSPEQALGQEVDQRTDIFSLGVVLYEMITGTHPFRGPTTAATFDALLNHEPPAPASFNPDVSPELERIIGRALEKDRELRYQTASDLRAELKRWQRTLDSSPTASTRIHARTGVVPRAVRRARVVTAGLALAALLVVATSFFVALWWLRSEEVAAPLRNLSFAQLTDQPGTELFPSLSPDGKSIVYASKSSGNWDLYLQRVGGKNPLNLTADSTDDDTQPAFSPDGERIVFRSERERGGIFVMGATGESVKRLTDFGYHPAWSPDGSEIACATHNIEDPNDRPLERSDIWIVNATTGERRQLTGEPTGDAAQPQWSPTGARLAYWSRRKGGQRDLWTIPAAGGTPVPVTDDAAFDWNPVWSPDGQHLYFASDRGGQMNLWRVPIEEGTGMVTGPPESLTTPSPYAQHVSFSRDGRRAVYVSQVSSKNILKADFNPDRAAITGRPVAVTQGFKHTSQPNLSPDGEWFVYSTQGEKQEDLFIIDKDGAGAPHQLTDDHFKDRHPRWSPDGQRIVFYTDRSGRYEAWTINRDGSGLRQMTFTTGETVIYTFWSPDGARLIYNQRDESCWIIEVGKPWSEQTPQRVPNPPGHSDVFRAFSWSPDGRQLGGWINSPTENPGILIYTFETNNFERITDFGSRPIWLHDNRRLLFRDAGKLFLVNSETKKTQEISLRSPHPVIEYGLTGDDRTLYYTLAATEADIWLLKLE